MRSPSRGLFGPRFCWPPRGQGAPLGAVGSWMRALRLPRAAWVKAAPPCDAPCAVIFRRLLGAELLGCSSAAGPGSRIASPRWGEGSSRPAKPSFRAGRGGRSWSLPAALPATSAAPPSGGGHVPKSCLERSGGPRIFLRRRHAGTAFCSTSRSPPEAPLASRTQGIYTITRTMQVTNLSGKDFLRR